MISNVMFRWTGGRFQSIVMAGAFCTVILIGLLDSITGFQVAFAAFYLIPIVTVTLLVSRQAGIVVSVVSAAAWLLADISSGRSYANPMIPYWNAAVRVFVFLALVFIMWSLQRERTFARRDLLTGVANRRLLFETGSVEIARCRRYRRPLTLVYFDCDNFKVVNDRFGNNEGDRLLQAVAEGVRRNVRSTDLVARLGGDEFVILLPETGYEGARVVTKNIHSKLAHLMEKQEWPITVSVGSVTFLRPPTSVDVMVKRADELMDAVKRRGGNLPGHQIVDEGGVALNLEDPLEQL